MNDAFESDTTLVTGESDVYDLGLDATIALSILSFVLGLSTLVKVLGLSTSGDALGTVFVQLLGVIVGGVGVVALFSYANVVPVTSQRVRGIGLGLVISATVMAVVAYALPISLATMLGLVLLFQAAALVTAGVVSTLNVVDTQPDMSAGLLAGGVFGAIGLVLGMVLGASVFAFGSVPWFALALVSAIVLAAVTIAPREDLGSTIPTALVVGVLGVVVVAGIIGVDWSFDMTQIRDTLSGGFTGGVVIPLFVIFGSLLSSWAGAKCRAGFGAQGRQYGAFFVINLNAFLMVAIMVSIVIFVVSRGVVYAFHDFTVGALTLLVLTVPVLVLALNWARRPAGTDEWHSAARQFFRVIPVAAIGSLAAVLVGILATGTTVSQPFTYTVLQNRVDTSIETAFEITPSLDLGAWMLLLSATLLFVYFFRKVGSLQNIGTRFERLDTLKQGISLLVTLMILLVLVMGVFSPSPLGIPLGSVVGVPLTYLGGVLALGLAVLPLSIFVTGSGDTDELAYERTQYVSLGFYGSLVTLLATVLLETAAVTTPGLGPLPFGLVTTAALVGVAVAAVMAVILFDAGRSSDTPTYTRVLKSQVTLALASIAGFLALLSLHVTLTGSTVNIAGVTLANGGSLSWPFVMENQIPLAPDGGGIFPAIVGTVWLVVGASLFAIPLGVGAAVFLTEYAEQGYFTGLVEVATNALWSTPSVVFGLFGAAFLLPRFGDDTSLLAGQLVLGFMLLPLVLITSREAIKSVPDEYRDASAALGVNRWKTIRSVVLPAAMPGVITGVILGVGRIAGETAPLILVLGSSLSRPEPIDVLGGFNLFLEAPFIFNEALLSESPALPTGIWAVITAGVSGSTSRGWATAFVLLTVVLLFYAIGIVSRTYFRRKLDYE